MLISNLIVKLYVKIYKLSEFYLNNNVNRSITIKRKSVSYFINFL